MNCPNKECKRRLIAPIIRNHNDGSDNVGNLEHSHLECPGCGWQFNHWHCSVEKIKEAFGKDFHLYL
jgi:hypothetical protein